MTLCSFGIEFREEGDAPMAYNVVFVGTVHARHDSGYRILVPYKDEASFRASMEDSSNHMKGYEVLEAGVSDERGAELISQARPSHRFTKYLGADIDMKK